MTKKWDEIATDAVVIRSKIPTVYKISWQNFKEPCYRLHLDNIYGKRWNKYIKDRNILNLKNININIK